MMNITFKRHYRLLIALFLAIGVFMSMGSTRIISYNFGEGKEIEVKGKDYDNDVYLFDDSVVHEIEIGLNKADYDAMVQTYQDSGDKDYYQTYIIIDGVTIPDVGVRLKGNLTLRQTLGGKGNWRDMLNDQLKGGEDGAEEQENAEIEQDQGIRMDLPDNPENMIDEERMAEMRKNMPMPPGMDLPDNWEEMTDEERRAYMQENGMGQMPGGGMGDPMGGEGNGGNPPFLIKFDEFVSGQAYQGFAEIAVRLGSDRSLLGEPMAFYIHEEAGQIIPETAYAVVETAENEPSLYVICEHIDEKYIEKHFPDSDGVLYKAGNFVGFEYKGEDPALYDGSFEQQTSINDDDMAPLIRFLKFVSESDDATFEANLPDWLDIDSFVRMMALDNLLSNNDSFTGMGSNYYLYYDKSTQKFTILSWDMNLSMGGMGGMMGGGDKERTESDDKRMQIMEEWMKEGGFGENADQQGGGQRGGPGGRSGVNTLKTRFFANEKFSAMYDAEYARLSEFIFGSNWALEKADGLIQLFTDYNAENNIMEQSEYDSGAERIKSYLQSKSE